MGPPTLDAGIVLVIEVALHCPRELQADRTDHVGWNGLEEEQAEVAAVQSVVAGEVVIAVAENDDEMIVKVHIGLRQGYMNL